MKLSPLLFAVSLTVAPVVQAVATQPIKLLGEWELCSDPDGDPKDVITFSADGKGIVTNADGRAYSLDYTVQGNAIKLEVKILNKRAEMNATLSADGRTLAKHNDAPSLPSTYVRKGNPDRMACTAK